MLLIRDYIGEDPERFARLMDIFLSGGYRLQQRASWALMHCVDRHPALVKPYLPEMLPLLGEPVHESVRRNITRILRVAELPRKLQGEIASHCFRLLADAGSSIAVKVFSMYTLQRIAEVEPELGRELRLLIEDQLPYAAPAFRVAAAKVLRKAAGRSL